VCALTLSDAADYFPPDLYPSEDGALYRLGEQRLATIFFYLNTVEEGAGGETVFPYAGDDNPYKYDRERINYTDCTRGLRVRPVRGTAILWYNVLSEGHMNGALDVLSLHGACPLRRGVQKWGANKWLRNKRVSMHDLMLERAATRARASKTPHRRVIEESDASASSADLMPTPGFVFRRIDQHRHVVMCMCVCVCSV
jgi:hypothetical protein